MSTTTQREAPSSRPNNNSKMKTKTFYELMSDPVSKPIKQKLITKDLARDIYLPRERPPLAALVTSDRLSTIKKHAIVVTKEEKEAMIEKQKEEREKIKAAAAARKAKMEEIDLFRKKNAKLNDLEEETKKNMEYLREKANQQRQENEEEIKAVNGYVIAAKVQAIRDIQTMEKVVIKDEHKHAESLLDKMMEKLRVEGLKKEDEEIAERRREAYAAGSLLQEQIRNNLEKRILEKEKKNLEGEKQKRKFEKMRLEDERAMKAFKENQRKILEELHRENEELRKLHDCKKIQSREEDIKITAIQRHKAEEEEAAEKERKEIIRKREIEIAKIRAQQEKASDIQAEKDALRARRAEEQKEREYRKKLKEETIRNRAVQEDLLKNRAEQLNHKEYILVQKAQKDAQEYAGQMQKRNDEIEKEAMMIRVKRIQNLKHNDYIRQQIREKEMEKIQKRRDFFEEGAHKKQEDKMRDQRLRAIQKSKVDDLTNYDISDTYIAHINRKFGLKRK